MLQASSQFRVPLMFAGLGVIAIMGIATYVVFAVLEARLTGWATRRQDAPLASGGGGDVNRQPMLSPALLLPFQSRGILIPGVKPDIQDASTDGRESKKRGIKV